MMARNLNTKVSVSVSVQQRGQAKNEKLRADPPYEALEGHFPPNVKINARY